MVDDDLIADAQAVLGTQRLNDTIVRALTEVIGKARRRQLAEQFTLGEGLDLDESTRRAARRWRAQKPRFTCAGSAGSTIGPPRRPVRLAVRRDGGPAREA